MAAITTYTELKTAMADWSARSDLTTHLDGFIDLTEAALKRTPTKQGMGGVRVNKTLATGTLSTSVATLDIPADFLEMDRLRLTADTPNATLRFVPSEQLGLYKRTGAGLPSYYTVTSASVGGANDEIEFNVVPDSAYAYELSYWPNVPALGAAQTANWILTNHPELYLSGCMYYLSRFIKDSDEAKNWAMEYIDGAWQVNEAAERGRYTRGPLTTYIDSAAP